MPKFITGLLLLCLLVGKSTGQTTAPGEISLGQPCPDFLFHDMVFAGEKTFTLADLKGRLVILDFWATWCKPCITALPDMQSLQDQFKDSIAIIPVTYQDKKTIEAFFQRKKDLQHFQLPVLTGDTLLRQYFPHNSVPHEVWIGPDGNLLATSSGHELTETNIRAAIRRQRPAVAQKKDIMDADLAGKPLLLGGMGSQFTLPVQKLQFSSILLDHVPGLKGFSSIVFSRGEQIRIVQTNLALTKMYQDAFTKSGILYSKGDNDEMDLAMNARTVLEVKDSSIFYWPGKRLPGSRDPQQKYRLEKSYCYELIIPRKDSIHWREYMIQDLNRYFGVIHGIEAVREKRSVKCWALVRTSQKDRLATRGGKSIFIFDTDSNHVVLKNKPLGDMMFYLQQVLFYNYPVPIINETGVDGRVDIDIYPEKLDLASLSRALQPYGLAIIETERNLDMIIIRDKK